MSILICPDCKTESEGTYPPSTYAYCTACGSEKIPHLSEWDRRERAGYRLTLAMLKQERRKRKEG